MMNSINDMEIVISDRTTPEFVKSAHALSDFLECLSLNPTQNNTLIELISKNITFAERGAFGKGLKLGLKMKD